VRQERSPGRPAIGRWAGPSSLRARLLATALCLTAAGAAIIGVAGGLMARGDLMSQADQQLRAYADSLASRPFVATPLAAPAPGTRRSGGSAFSIEVRSAAGQLVMRAGSSTQPGQGIPAIRAAIPARAGELAAVAAAGGGSWLMIAEPVHYRARRIPYAYSAEDFSLRITSPARPGLAGTLVVGLDLASVRRAMHGLVLTFLAVSGIAALAVACLGAAVTGLLLRPLTRAREAAEAAAEGGLPGRLPDRDPRGDGGLARSLNAMLSQLERAFSASAASEAAARESVARLRQVAADTARELREPVGVIRGLAQRHRERGVRSAAAPGSAAEHLRVISRLEDETARIAAAVDRLPSASGGQQPRRAGDRAPE
jgi:two-component system OmpR family sensor kinase